MNAAGVTCSWRIPNVGDLLQEMAVSALVGKSLYLYNDGLCPNEDFPRGFLQLFTIVVLTLQLDCSLVRGLLSWMRPKQVPAVVLRDDCVRRHVPTVVLHASLSVRPQRAECVMRHVPAAVLHGSLKRWP